MKEYHKIETLYERSETTKKLIVGKFRNTAIEFVKDNKWIFTEKVDGTNIRVFWDGHKVTFGGRTENAQIPNHLVNRLIELFGGETNAQMFEQKFGETPVILFGEGYGVKIQSGGGYIDHVDFIMFDVCVGETWLERNSVEDISTYFGVQVVPIIFEGTIEQGVNFVLETEKSFIGKKQSVLEGLVGRPQVELKDRMGKRLIVKIKRCDFEGSK